MNRRAAIGAAALSVLVAGCATSPPAGPRRVTRRPPGSPPDYRAAAAAISRRVEPITWMSAPIVVRVWFRDDRGDEQSEQLEGLLQYVAPDRVMARFDKLGETYALLGCDQVRYWWIELGDPKRAWVGRHDLATPDRLGRLGLRVHPLDLIDLLGITPIPPDPAPDLDPGLPPAAWSDDGERWLICSPARAGVRRLRASPQTAEADRVELYQPRGPVELGPTGLSPASRLVAAADLSGYEPLPTPGSAEAPRVATGLFLTVPRSDLRARLWLYPPPSPRRPRDAAFDLERLLATYRVTDVTDLDEQAASAGPMGAEPTR